MQVPPRGMARNAEGKPAQIFRASRGDRVADLELFTSNLQISVLSGLQGRSRTSGFNEQHGVPSSPATVVLSVQSQPRPGHLESTSANGSRLLECFIQTEAHPGSNTALLQPIETAASGLFSRAELSRKCKDRGQV